MNLMHHSRTFRFGAPLAWLLAFSGTARPQAVRRPSSADSSEHEKKTARAFEAARANPLELRAFLVATPKGADLHMHLGGSVYAETLIRVAAEKHLCVDLEKLALTAPAIAGSSGSAQPDCAQGQVPAAKALTDQELYDALVDSFSMRGFVPTPGVTAHDHFFATFDKFKQVNSLDLGVWLDDVASRASSQNEQYLEIMRTPEYPHAAAAAKEIPWSGDFSEMRSQLLARGLRDDLAPDKEFLDAGEASRRQLEHCGQPNASPACQIQIRYLCQILRGLPKAHVFAQALMCFETASYDPRFVGINLVRPEDGYLSMADYALEMRIIGFLHTLYPKVHIALHAGELAPGLVPYEALCCHIRLAVEEAHAERIGHGVDIMYEDRPYDLLKEMATKHVMTEINLTSNEIILGIRGNEHPLPIYKKFHVPVALSTDDEGVSRIDLTHEFVRAVETYGFHYADVKTFARTSLEHSFLPGPSLWSAPDVFTSLAPPCSHDAPGSQSPSVHCAAFLMISEKARQQWELERRFRIFESKF